MEVKKSPDADLNKKRGALFMLGLILAVGFVLSSFEYQLFEKTNLTNMYIANKEIMEEAPLDIPPPPPPPPPIAPPPIIEDIKLVEDDKKINEDIVIVETDPNDKIEIVDIPIKEAPVVETIFDVVEEQAEFPGGVQKMYEYLGANLKYPAMAREAGVQGKVYVQFVVFKDGSIGEVKVLRGIGSGCDEEAMRVVKAMPKWNPGKQRKVPVSSRFNLPIVFKLG